VDDILVSIIVVIVTGLVIIGIFVITGRKKQQREAAIKQIALNSGWNYEPINQTQRKGFILRGEGWKLESFIEGTDRPSEAGSSDWSFTNKWSTDRITLPGELVMIGPKTPNVQLGQLSGLGSLVLQKALKHMLGADAEKATDLVEVFVGRISFRDRYSVWATSQAAAEKVLTYELENELLNWQLKESPVLKFSDRGVEITTRQAKLETPEEVRAMVGLGNAVLGT